MNCRSVQPMLSAYMDRELSGHEMLRIREHVSHCAECEQELEALRATKQMLGGLPEPTPTAGFEERLFNKVFQEESRGKRLTLRQVVTVAAFAAAATFALVNVLPRHSAAGQKDLSGASSPVASGIVRDQAFQAASDPLSGAAPVVLVADGH